MLLQLFLWLPSQTITHLPSKLFNNLPLAPLRPYTHYLPTTASDQKLKIYTKLNFRLSDWSWIFNEWMRSSIYIILEMYRIIFKMSFSCPDRTAQYVSWISFDFGTHRDILDSHSNSMLTHAALFHHVKVHPWIGLYWKYHILCLAFFNLFSPHLLALRFFQKRRIS